MKGVTVTVIKECHCVTIVTTDGQGRTTGGNGRYGGHMDAGCCAFARRVERSNKASQFILVPPIALVYANVLVVAHVVPHASLAGCTASELISLSLQCANSTPSFSEVSMLSQHIPSPQYPHILATLRLTMPSSKPEVSANPL